jgi:chemotaxis protein MotB
MKEGYMHYSDSLEKKLSLLTEELKAKSDQISNNEKLLSSGNQSLLIAKRDSVARELDNNVRNALSGYNPDELSTEMRGGKIYVSVSDNLLFKSGSTTVGDMGRKVLKKLSRVINQYQDINVSIEGNAGNKPVDLTAARAKAITTILSEEYDVNPTKLTSSGKGEFLRVSSNENAGGRAKRTDLVLSPGLDDLSKSRD